MSEIELSASEWKVAEVLWVEPGLTGAAVAARLPRRPGWKTKTVNTFLARMVRKGFLRTEKRGRAFCYHPLVPREDMLRSAARAYLSRAGAAGMLAALHIIVEEAAPGPADARALRKKLKGRS